ncbi:MAG: HNH endonuclease [Hyalangium sp.]|uniref:HNH endonuclease n=1 Tax=Hyalangium sp. TaxID=2028555 RepID=UPI00389AC4B5
MQQDAFEQLLLSAGLEMQDEWPVGDSALTPKQASRLLAVLLQKPMSLANFPPRLGASYLLREVLAGGEVSREELLRRVGRFNRVAVLRPDGYLAWVLSGRTQQKAGPVEWRDGAFRALGFELGRFYVSNGYVFRPADERLQPVFDSLQVEVYDDADVISRTLDGAQDALVELALAIGKLLTYPSDSLAALRNLPTGVAALIASSPEYLERFENMTRGEQVEVLSKLTTTLIVTWGTAGGTSGTLPVALGGAEATVPVLTLSAEGMLVLERIAVPVGTVATSVGAGVGGVYVLSTASQGKRTFSKGDRAAGLEKAKDANGVPRCEYCDTELEPNAGQPNSYEADHQTPYSKGGSSTQDNLAPACRTCNRSKGPRTPEEWKP